MINASQFRLREIDAPTLRRWIELDKTILIDVRESGEYASEHIPGARLIPLSALSPAALADIGDKTPVLYCRSSNRSGRAAQALLDAGYPEITHLTGGLQHWKDSGFDTARVHGAPIDIIRQVQLAAGSLVLAGTLLGTFVHPWFLALSGFVGAGLVFAGATGTCGMAMLLSRLPYNRRFAARPVVCTNPAEPAGIAAAPPVG